MEEWKFLLQKDGDRSWLSLDSPDVEILEGRYRIVVQTGQPQVSVNIRICHLATEEDPPKRRIQKRSNRTNEMGLMVMIPYTRMQPGMWEFSCFSADPMSDLMGDTLHHSVRLRVAALDTENLDDWEMPPSPADSYSHEQRVEPIYDQPALEHQDVDRLDRFHLPEIATPSAQEIAQLNVEIANALGLSMDRLVEMTDQISHQLIEEVFREFNLEASAGEEDLAGEISISDAAPIAHAVPTALSPAVEQPLSVQPPSVIDGSLLEIVLDQEMLVAGRGQELVITGRIALKSAEAESDRDLDTFPAWQEHLPAAECEIDAALGVELLALQQRQIPKEIQLVLRDPQSSETLLSDRLPFSASSLPVPFHFSWKLPTHLTTHLVLGEVLLCGLASDQNADHDSELRPLKSVACSITVDPEALVEELERVHASLAELSDAELSDAEQSADLVAQLSARMFKERSRSHLDLSFLNLTSVAPTQPTEPTAVPEDLPDPVPVVLTPQPSKPRGKQVLPPKLYEPDPEQTGKRRLDLPVFVARGRSASTMTATIEPELAQADGSSRKYESNADESLKEQSLEEQDLLPFEAIAPQNSDPLFLARQSLNLAIAPLEEETSLEPETKLDAEQVQQELILSSKLAIAELPSPEQAEFQALNLHDRFLNRLNALATDAELSVLLKQHPVQPDEAELAAAEKNAVVDAQTLDMGEVVVDDDPAWRDGAAQRARDRQQRIKEDLPLANNPLVLPEDQLVPTPILEIITDEIVAGKLINLRIKLPDLLPRIYVKIWVNDRQTRSLLDGPRWLVDFLPNGLGELEAATQITAPFGSTEIRLEAIAVEMQTQRESQKISLDRRVIPADIPEQFMSDFDF